MYKIIVLIAVSFALLILGYYYSMIKQGRFLLKRTIIGKCATKIAPKKNTKEYLKDIKLLQKSLLDIDLISFYSLKIVTIIVVSMFAILIFSTNTILSQEKIYNNVIYPEYAKTSIYNNPAVRKENIKLVTKYIKNIDDKNSADAKIQVILIKKGGISPQDAPKISAVVINDLTKINHLYSLKRLLLYLIIVISSFFIPDIILFTIANIRKEEIKKEELYLINLLAVIGSNLNITAQGLMTILTNNAKYLKPLLQKFQMAYYINRTEAYNLFMLDKDKQAISKIINLLRQIEDSNKELALNNIKKYNENIDKIRKLEYQNKIENKEGLILLLFTIGTVLLMMLIVNFAVSSVNQVQNMKF
ncbi:MULTISPECIES: hypothetical protein [Clostridium]|uniref:Uncharacterized protein n=4 Tax=Clostridium TaxID=1485 RepID=A0A6M0T5A2_CLOBO|nr:MULTISPECIES: hypothetical protein [Clostridium]APF25346.1 putative membrane protein [Clostridium sporogenes]APH13265.1 putative membrane protein [Clostridium sporogenes]KOY66052.1 hypothetical protein AN649_09540 [Clostridium sporogenes]MBD5639877.1 hypothetical protein [Clostridium botulinum]MDI6919070.1 hypothetical protein [Clostridium botulinum]